MIVKNPTPACRKTVTVLSEGYTQTCHNDTCTCMSHDAGYSWIEIPEEQASLVKVIHPEYLGSHPFTRSVYEHNILMEKALAEEARKKKIAQKEWIKEKQEQLKKAYGEQWFDRLWSMKIPFITEEPVVAAVKALTSDKKHVHHACVDERAISKLRREHFPLLTGPRFESALKVADVLNLLDK